ncbi:MAG: chromosome segregation protein SMC [Bacillota bacterium]|nr:chromosome segregation protein SMC [Bacillota bacterium]
MLLKSLDIQGFKTFPDKTKLKFDKGITAVVGPNGSGKSNISDAIRWVLGEQSAKTLRCSKMEDIVFNGTDIRKKQGFSEVTLTIENKDRLLPFDSDDVAITRRYYRSGESEYLINKAAVRLKDINELFMDTGLGRDGYSMIGQGKIDSIVSSKSEERREIFEEAAGISRCRYRKAEAERRLKNTEDNLFRLKDILIELEERVGPLKIQAEKAESFLVYSEEKRGLEIALWLNTLEKSGSVLHEQENKIAIARAQYDAVLESLQQINEETEANYLKTGEFASKIDETRREISSYEEKCAEKRSAVSVLENDLLHNSATIERLKSEIENVDETFNTLEQSIEEKKTKITEIEKIKNEKQENYNEATEELNSLHLSSSKSSTDLQEITTELSQLNVKSADARVSEITSASSILELETRISNLQLSKAAKVSQLSELNNALSDYDLMLKNTNERTETLMNALKGLGIRLSNRQSRVNDLKSTADKLMLDVSERNRRTRLLEELERNLEGFSHSVKIVMSEAQKGKLGGIVGAVSRVISVPSEYTVAIETALGAAMQNIVTNTDEDAKRAISYLKEHDGGRATFLPVSTIKGSELNENGLDDCYGFIGIASRLCSCDAKFTNILQSLLGRIVIAEDLNSAVVIAKKYGYRFRVVTLDGQVVNAGGSLTGGSLARNSGLLSRQSEIEKNKQIAIELSKKYETAKAELLEAEQEFAAVEAEILGANAELQQATHEQIQISSERKNCEAEICSQTAALDEIEKECSVAAERIEGLKATKQEASNILAEFSEKIKAAEAKIEELSGSRSRLKEQRDALSLKLQELRLEIVAATKDIEQVEAEISSAITAGENHNERKSKLFEEISEVENKNKEISDNINTYNDEIVKYTETVKELNEKIESLANEQSEVEKRSVELRTAEREKADERETTGRELSRLEERKINLQNQYDEIISKLWEEYELTRREAEEQAVEIESVIAATKRLNELKAKIKALGTVNVGAVEEYKEVSERYTFLSEQVADVEKSKNDILKLITDLNKQMRDVFIESFNDINEHFGKIFTELFGGGKAFLQLTDSQDILNCGIEIAVHPPGKIVVHLDALSGGEKALVAIALYFAIMKVRPAPFCVMDEIEAALDEVNVDRFATYLRRMNKDTQFIVITHRRGTMEESDVLYGVTMQDKGVSKLLEMRASEALAHVSSK